MTMRRALSPYRAVTGRDLCHCLMAALIHAANGGIRSHSTLASAVAPPRGACPFQPRSSMCYSSSGSTPFRVLVLRAARG